MIKDLWVLVAGTVKRPTLKTIIVGTMILPTKGI